MTTHITATRDQWLEAWLDLLAAEKDLTRRSDEVARLRQQLPWVRVEKNYVFEGPNGRETLADLFAGRSQLVVQQFVLAPGWEQGCKSCSYMADHTDGMTIHLAHRDVTIVAISRAPLAEIESFRRRMGWQFIWVSSHGTDFNYDFGVSFTPEEVAKGKINYNFGNRPLLIEELPGSVCSPRTMRTSLPYLLDLRPWRRGDDGHLPMLDLTPKGRDEKSCRNMAWVRHHDRYEPAPAKAVPAAGSCCSARA